MLTLTQHWPQALSFEEALAGVRAHLGLGAEFAAPWTPQRANLARAVMYYRDSGLLELLFPDTKRLLLAIHRRDPKKDEECGHCVALYWTGEGRVGSLSKSSFKGLGHREPEFPDETAIAASYAKAYLEMAFEPLYYGVTTLEEAAPDLDWRFHEGNLNEISSRLQACYAYGFVVDY